MKTSNIPNKRKLKHLLKSYQRNKIEGFRAIRLFFAEKGVVVVNGIHEIYRCVALPVVKFNRLMRICTRIGKVAKKQNMVISLTDILTCIRFNQDPRNIKFLTAFYSRTIQEVTNLRLRRDNSWGYIITDHHSRTLEDERYHVDLVEYLRCDSKPIKIK